jgi:peptidoglycan/LPS O-acetylase OafA/YrhL
VHAKPDSRLILPIEGLRGVSVVVVLLYHLGAVGFSGGFVGVDCFFVISGFIITRQLVFEWDSKSRISIASFYARRAKRILPSSTLVLLATLLGARFFLEPLRLYDLSLDAFAATTFWINILFSFRSVDYLASALPPSPLQHYWSLAVEEQFYAVFPLLFLGILKVSRHQRRLMILITGVLILGSFVTSLRLTTVSQPLAFFMAPTRAWQFLAGCIVALLQLEKKTIEKKTASILAMAGVLTIVIAVSSFSDATKYPGWAALLPTLGSVTLIAVSTSPCHMNQVIGHPLLRWFGARSYVLYLWHWPIIIFLQAESEGDLTGGGIALALFATFSLTELTHRFFETPLRSSSIVTKAPRRGLLLGLLAVLIGIVSSAIHTTTTTDSFGEGRSSNLVSATLAASLAESLKNSTLPANLAPPLNVVFEDEPMIYGLGCHDYDDDTPRVCRFGEPSARTRIALVGDSHAAQWFEPIRAMSAEQGWYFVSATRSGCSTLGRFTPDRCSLWYENLWKLLSDEKIEVVVLSSLFNHGEIPSANLVSGLRDIRTTAVALGITPVFIADTPWPSQNIPICLSANTTDIQRCVLQRSTSVLADVSEISREAFDNNESVFIDTEDWFCMQSVCPAVVGDVVVYRDSSHVTSRYAELLGLLLYPYIARAIELSN